jgi:hypothetical protein
VKHHSARRRLAAILALVVAMSGLVVAAGGPAVATPRPLAEPGDNGDDGEGGSKSLIQQLEAASKGYVEAKEALEKSRKRQAQLAGLIKQLDTELGPRQQALDELAGRAYRVGRLGPVKALLTASSTGSLLDRAETLETVAVEQDRALRDLKATRTKQAQAKTAVDAAVREQQTQLTVMAKRKAQAENALKAANQGQDAEAPSGGGSSSARASAGPGGSGGCTVNDPTTSGCITPRMAHALSEAKEDGFTRFVACFRQQNSGEHPKGRACDFAADKSGFGGDATGASRDYGDRLAKYFVSNADPLGVLYVIWYRRIWLPSSGWKSYSGAGGDPSSDHTNHVHLSVR